MAENFGLSHVTPLIVFAILLSLVVQNDSELRFCLNGPQRMKDSDCPGGFVFKESTNPSCKYYAKDDANRTGIVLSAPVNLCDGDGNPRAIENPGDDLADLNGFTHFTWEELEDANDTLGVFTPENICQDDCLADWEDRNWAPDEEPIPEDWDPDSVSEADKKYCKKMNKEMFIRILMDDDEADGENEPTPEINMEEFNIMYTPLEPSSPTENLTPVDNKPSSKPTSEPKPATMPGNQVVNSTGNSTLTARRLASFVSHNMEKNIDAGFSLVSTVPYDATKMNVIKLLAKAMKVAIAVCAPFVREEFYEQVLKAMIFIGRKLESKILDVGLDLYKNIAAILDHCVGKKDLDFILNGTRCEGMEKVDGVFFVKSKKYWPYRLTGRSFRWGKYHPILDAVWTTLDIVQSVCFESFSSNMMMSHVFFLAMDELFPREIKILWRLDPDLKNDKFWNNLLQTYDLNVTMRNLDACAYGARNTSIFEVPLPRPFLTMEDLEKEAPASEATPEYPKGWNKTIAKYWEHYEKQGGFKKVSEEFGKCFQENDILEEQLDMVDELRKTC